MVNCDNCGVQNDDEAEYCIKCGNPFRGGEHHSSRDHWMQQRGECFGLPQGNIIGPLIVGVILIMVGLSSVYGFHIWTYIWPALIIIVGVLIIAGAIYNARKK